MKRTVLISVILFLLCPINVYANDNNTDKEKGLHFSVGTWYLQWEQNDEPDHSAISIPIESRFEIEDSFAKEVSIYGKWQNLRGKIDAVFANSKLDNPVNSVSDNANRVKKLAGNFILNKYNICTRADFTYTETEGNAKGYDPETGQKGLVDFNTYLRILDLSFYPDVNNWLRNIGLGYRFLNYTLPESIYLIDNGENPEEGKWLDPAMEWRAHYLTFNINSSKQLLDTLLNAKSSGYKFYFDFSGGWGFKVTPESKVIKKANADQYLDDGRAYFFESDFGLLAFKKLNSYPVENKVVYCKLGYRISKHVLETRTEDDINIYARAVSRFSGPFINLNLKW